MAFYRRSFGDSRTMERFKPRKPLLVDRPAHSRIYLHPGESQQGFQFAAVNSNFFMEMMKYLPSFADTGFAGGNADEFFNAVHDLGDASINPFWEGSAPYPQLWEGEGPPPNNTDYYTLDEQGRPTNNTRINDPWNQGNGYGRTLESFGSWHRVPREDGLPLGFFLGVTNQNLNYKTSAGEFNHFTESSGEYGTIDGVAKQLAQTYDGWNVDQAMPDNWLDNLFGIDHENYDNVWNDGLSVSNGNNTVQIFSEGVKDYLEGYGGDYYDIVTSGFKHGAALDKYYLTTPGEGEGIRWADGGDMNDGLIHYNGAFDYDNRMGANGEGAFMLALGLLETRRRMLKFNYNFADPQDIGRIVNVNGVQTASPDDQAIISHFDSMLSDPNRGAQANPHNLIFMNQALQMQHDFHSVFAAYSFDPDKYSFGQNYSNGNMPGWVHTSLDQASFWRFNNVMKDGLTSFLGHLDNLASNGYQGASDLRTWAGNLVDEYYGTGANDRQPWLDQAYDGDANGSRIGWDKYCSNTGDYGDVPNANPVSPAPHSYYAMGQMEHINPWDRTATIIGEPGYENFANRNWVVHITNELNKLVDKDVGYNISISTQNRRLLRDYKQAKEQHFEDTIEAKFDEAREEALMLKAAAKKAAELRGMQQASQAKAKEINMMLMASFGKKSSSKAVYRKKPKQKAKA